MTMPRMVVAGRTHLVTRKCAGDCLFLTPKRRHKGSDDEVTDTYLYCLGLAVLQTGIEIHAFCAMGNHHHQCLTDVLGVLPWFAQRFHANVARALNLVRGRSGSFWEGAKKYNAVHCARPDDVLDKMVYVALNPVAAGLVSTPEEWPGAISLPHMYAEGYEIVVKKPRRFFRQLRRDGSPSGEVLSPANARQKARRHKKEKEPHPDEVRYRLELPPGYKHLSRADFVTLFAERLKIGAQRIKEERAAVGRPRPLGLDKIFRQDWREPPPSKKKLDAQKQKAALEPASAVALAPKPPRAKKKGPEDFLDPRIACKDFVENARLREALLQFWADYRLAYEVFRRRRRGVLFPHGTWGPKQLYGARVLRAA